MLSGENAEVLAGIRSQPWPDPAGYPRPQPLQARLSWRKLAASGLFALLLAALIAAMLRDKAMTAEPYQGWRLWLRIAAALGSAVLGCIALGSAAQALRRSVPLLSLTASGLTCPTLYEHPLPWGEIALVIHERPRIRRMGGGRIILGVRHGERFGRLPSGDLKPAPRSGGIDAAQLPQLLDVPTERLLDAIQAYRAQAGPAEEGDPIE